MIILPYLKFHFTKLNKGLDLLFPEEKLLTKKFESPRINSFCSGRYCAHKCLDEFGIHSTAVLMKKNGAPQWPDGFVGSISHSKKYAGAVVANKESYQSIGFDIEEVNRIQPDIWHLLFTKGEQLFLSKHTLHEQQVLATIFFSIKESFYKFSSGLTSDFIDFLDVEVIKNNNSYFIKPIKSLGVIIDDKAINVNVTILKTDVISYIAM